MNSTLRSTLLAAAATLVAGTAGAQSEVVIYGVAMPFLEQVKTSGATQGAPADRPTLVPATAYTGANAAGRTRISVGTTQLGLRGSETLSPALKLVWQLESGFQIDDNAGPGLGARNSKVGLAGPWGEINLGQWDTPYKFVSLPLNPFRAGYVFDYTGIMGNPGFGVPATTTQFTRIGARPDAAFDKRAGNQVQYWSPRVGGFSARLGWSVDEGRTTDTATTASIRPQIWSAALMFDAGALSLRYAYEQHDDYFGLSQIFAGGSSAAGSLANRSSKDRAHKLVAMYRVGATRLGAAAEELDYRNEDSLPGAMSRYQRRAFYGIVEQGFGTRHALWAAYGRAENGSCERVGGLACSASNVGADFLSVGYIYRFSRRTEAYLVYYRLNNKESGTYSPQPVAGGAVAPGADTEGAGVGLIHYF